MKLLFVHQKLGEFGGAEANIRLSASELRRRGYTTALLYEENTGRNEAQWRETFGQCFQLSTHGKAEFTRLVLRQFRPELVYLHNLADLDVVETLLSCGIPVVRMVHDHALYCMRSYKYNYFTRHICTRALSPFCVFPCLASFARNPGGRLPIQWVSYSEKKRELALNQRCSWFVVYSHYLKQELVRNGLNAEKIDVCIPMSMQNDSVAGSSFGPRNLILFVGQVIRGKGVDVLLQSLAKVRTHFECAIVGDGNARSHCERLSVKLGLQDRVRFYGYVVPADLGKFYREASVFVMASLWPEPFGMAGPEAMRYGLPVIAFDAGGIREWLTDGENGYLIPWKHTDLFAARLAQLLRDKNLAGRLGRKGLETVQRYDSVRQIDHLEQIFRRVLHVTEDATRTAGFSNACVGL